LREETVTEEKKLCVLCAWRENCQKRFIISTDQLGNVQCPDYCRDVSIRKDKVPSLIARD
jgi:hypothetical protein